MVKIFYYFGHHGINFVYTIIYMNSRLELDNWYNVAVSVMLRVFTNIVPEGDFRRILYFRDCATLFVFNVFVRVILSIIVSFLIKGFRDHWGGGGGGLSS
jgi:hypothetical protein